MFRWLIRLFLVGYFVLPIVSFVLIFSTIQQIQADVEPVITRATTTINAATSVLDNELRNMGRNFQPLVSTVNSIISGLNTITSFTNDAINVMVDAVNNLTFNTLRIRRFSGISIPPLVDLSFINRISENVGLIGTQVTAVTTTLSTTITTRLELLTLSIGLLIVWIVSGFLLMGYSMFSTLWKGR